MDSRRRESVISKSNRHRNLKVSNSRSSNVFGPKLKVKAHRREPANEEAEIHADITMSSKDFPWIGTR